MWQPIDTLLDRFREDFGEPRSLRRLLAEQPCIAEPLAMPRQGVSANAVVCWHEWGAIGSLSWPRLRPGEVRGWGPSGNRYASFTVHRPEFTQFGRCKEVKHWHCDIQDVQGLAAAKSDLTSFASLDAMVETHSPAMIADISESGLAKNLAHDEIRLLHRVNPSDHFAHYAWDGRLFLINDGGAHHFAAARYIAARLVKPVPLAGTLRRYSIDAQAVASLKRDFDLFAIPDQAEACNGLHDAMQALRAPYLWRRLPRALHGRRAIFLPRNTPRAVRAAALLREAGVFDLGEHLGDLLHRQASAAPPL